MADRMMVYYIIYICMVLLSLLEAIQRRALVVAFTSYVRLDVATL